MQTTPALLSADSFLPVIGWHMHSLGTGKFCRFCWSERIHSEISDHGIVAVVKHYIFRLWPTRTYNKIIHASQ